MLINTNRIPGHKIDIIGICGRIDTDKKEFASVLKSKIEKISSKPVIKIGFADQIRKTPNLS